MKVTFGEWAVRLRTRPSPPVIIASYKGKDKKKINVETFDTRGMITFPKALVTLIREDLRHANSYDRLLDKFYEWYDNEY